jgi:hypothetical protein
LVTLVQVLAGETSLHMACDFCLTNPYTKKVVQNNAFKLVSLMSPSVSALVGVTGIAVLDGKPIGQWIADVLAGLQGHGSVDGVLNMLVDKAVAPLSQVADAVVRRHTFVVGAVIGTQTRVSLVSNFEVFDRGRIRRSPTAAMTLR